MPRPELTAFMIAKRAKFVQRLKDNMLFECYDIKKRQSCLSAAESSLGECQKTQQNFEDEDIDKESNIDKNTEEALATNQHDHE